jgi:hypothetical protein
LITCRRYPRHGTTNRDSCIYGVCSALPGSMADGMGAPRARHHSAAGTRGRRPAISEPERPRRRHALAVAALRGDRLMATGPIHQWARVGAARAERAEGRSGARSGAGKRARRSGAQPGLDEVGKLSPR